MPLEVEEPRGVSDRDIADAREAVTASLVDAGSILKLPPQLVVNLGNIKRCLEQLKASRAAGRVFPSSRVCDISQ